MMVSSDVVVTVAVAVAVVVTVTGNEDAVVAVTVSVIVVEAVIVTVVALDELTGPLCAEPQTAESTKLSPCGVVKVDFRKQMLLCWSNCASVQTGSEAQACKHPMKSLVGIWL